MKVPHTAPRFPAGLNAGRLTLFTFAINCSPEVKQTFVLIPVHLPRILASHAFTFLLWQQRHLSYYMTLENILPMKERIHTHDIAAGVKSQRLQDK